MVYNRENSCIRLTDCATKERMRWQGIHGEHLREKGL